MGYSGIAVPVTLQWNSASSPWPTDDSCLLYLFLLLITTTTSINYAHGHC